MHDRLLTNEKQTGRSSLPDAGRALSQAVIDAWGDGLPQGDHSKAAPGGKGKLSADRLPDLGQDMTQLYYEGEPAFMSDVLNIPPLFNR
jgi:hypothetical protein